MNASHFVKIEVIEKVLIDHSRVVMFVIGELHLSHQGCVLYSAMAKDHFLDRSFREGTGGRGGGRGWGGDGSDRRQRGDVDQLRSCIRVFDARDRLSGG